MHLDCKCDAVQTRVWNVQNYAIWFYFKSGVYRINAAIAPRWAKFIFRYLMGYQRSVNPLWSKKNYIPKEKQESSETPKKKRKRKKESCESEASDIGESFEMDFDDPNYELIENPNLPEENPPDDAPEVDIKIEEICED